MFVLLNLVGNFLAVVKLFLELKPNVRIYIYRYTQFQTPQLPPNTHSIHLLCTLAEAELS